MSVQDRPNAGQTVVDSTSALVRAAIWVAIGALIAAAIVCVIWVLVGTQNGIVGRAFLTILLLAAFAGVAILDAHLAPRRPAWFALASMATWVITLLIGAVMIWLPDRYPWVGLSRLVQFLLIVLVLQLALLHIRLYMKALQRYVTPFTQTVAVITIALVIGLAVMLVLPLMLGEWVVFRDLYWRFVVAITILAAVGTALVPLLNALFAPKRPRPVPAPHPAPAAGLPPWPTYADGVTPLPLMPDGSPDWNAYYTGYPSLIPQAIAPVAPMAAPPQAGPTEPRRSGYDGYPPPPPLPPRPQSPPPPS
jgi:MFS family permease